MSLLGIDIGSGSCKGVVFDTNGHQLASESVAYVTSNPQPSFVEINALSFRDAVFDVIRKLSVRTPHDPIEALAVSSHGETIIPVDAEGNAIAPAIMNSDNRAVAEAEWWRENFGTQEIYEVTGLPLHAMFSLNKIMWLRKHRREIYNKAHKFLSVGDYILMQLGMPPYTDYSLASRTMAFDIEQCRWSISILNHCGIHQDKLAIPVASGTVAGRLSKAVAGEFGLAEGTVVALGGHDQPCGALGAGAINSGDIYDSAGTYECMVAVSDRRMNHPHALKYSFNSYPHVVPGKFVTLAFFPAALVSHWFIEQFCYQEKMKAIEGHSNIYDLLAEELPAGPTGLCITPHFVGACTPHWDVNARGVMSGFNPGITRHHIYKAIYEGIACELRINVDALQEVVGPFSQMRISGGNSRSSFSVQLRADITGKTFGVLKNDEAVCLGAAMLAGTAIGKYKDLQEAVDRLVHIRNTYKPDMRSQQEYEKQLERYKTIHL